ncbi:MAG: tetratricopeptide repeat protein [Candidatus Komeilibacteria bacterium]|nr:tetratricopeptide repeat protein [Candidatus Komeilibacteria bacterium]
MIPLIHKIGKNKVLMITGLFVILLAVGLTLFLKNKEEQLYLPVQLDEETRIKTNERIAQNLEMLKLFPNDYNVYMDLGNLSANLGNASEAIKYYQTAWEIIPSNSTPWLNIGNIYIRLGDYRQAEQAFLKAKEVNPVYHFVYFNLAKLYEDFLPAKSDKIKEIYLEGLKNTNNDYQLLQPFTDYLVRANKYSEALEYLNVLLQKVPAGSKQQILDRIKEVKNLAQQPTG